MKQRDAMTGVVAPDAGARRDAALAELSELLGVPVTGVEDRLNRRTSRKEGVFRWIVDVTSAAGGTWRVGVLDSATFRVGDDLNLWAARWGRDVESARLTPEDGRRALRLMHDVTEAEDELSGRAARREECWWR